MNNSKNLILDLSFEFAVHVAEYTEALEVKKKYNVANQLFRSGTSIGAMINEAQSAESRADFIHKMKVADKEAHETEFWLRLCERLKTYPKDEKLIEELTVIKRVLGKILSVSIKNK